MLTQLPGDSRRIDLPPFDPSFVDMTNADLQELYGNVIVAILFMQHYHAQPSLEAKYLWDLCCTGKLLSFSMVQPLTLSNYEIERRLQVSKLSGAIAITNSSGKDAVISAVLVEHVGGTQSYFIEGCGYKELPNIVVKTGGGLS
jgi:hypothetical protein